MAARNADTSVDSLELLLDTICNAFGGILFLTIFLTMLLRLSAPKNVSRPVTDEARSEMTDLSGQLDLVAAELESLERSLQVQTSARARLVDEDMETSYRAL